MTDIGDTNGDLLSGSPLRLEALKWVLRLTSGDATSEDIAALDRWRGQSPRHAEAFLLASRSWHSFGQAAETVMRQDKVASKRPLRARNSIGHNIGRRAFLGGMATASVAGLALAITEPPLGLWPSLNEFTADYRTVPGEQRIIALPGSGSIEMNTRTSLNLRTKAADDGSVDLISGEATIATGAQPIAVLAGNGKAWAQGAQFNIRYDEAAVCVTCLDGVVHVEQGKVGQTALLQQGQQITYTDRGLGQMRVVDLMLVVGWRQGDLFFQNEPLSGVIDEVNRYRLGKIILINKELGTRRVTARFKIDRLDIILAQLKETFGAQLTTLPGGIVLVS